MAMIHDSVFAGGNDYVSDVVPGLVSGYDGIPGVDRGPVRLEADSAMV